MKKEDILKRLQQLKTKLATEYHVKSIGLFGSIVRDEATVSSDIDVLVEFTREADLLDLVGLSIFLEEELGCPVDVVSLGGLREELKEHVLPEVVYV
ncbi:MAG: nucleotidyltransferase family protein [Candidatus Ranarchaeia archaeon]